MSPSAAAAARILTLLSVPTPLLSLAARRSSLLLLHLHRHHSPLRLLSTRFHFQANSQFLDSTAPSSSSAAAAANSRVPHPWPEWGSFLQRIDQGGYFSENRVNAATIEFVRSDGLSEEFVRAANACMAFARDNAGALWSVSRKDVEVVVENGSAFLFRNGEDSRRRMKDFLNGNDNNVPEYDKPSAVDLMRFLLSYASTVIDSSEATVLHNRELIESSVRNLFAHLAGISASPQGASVPGSVTTNFPGTYGQPRPAGQHIQMKRGDWICQRCSFMNFAKNMKCLECNEPRPKGQLTGGEWECPQCDFFNYGRNLVCLKCDCKKPGADSFKSVPRGGGWAYSAYSRNSNADKRVAENESKPQRWFTRISQLVSTPETSAASAGEDSPAIIPSRKCVNRVVASTRKTPLERKLAYEQYRRNVGNFEGNDSQSLDGDKSLRERINQELCDMLSQRSSVLDTNKNLYGSQENFRNEIPSATSFPPSQYGNLVNANHGNHFALSKEKDHASNPPLYNPMVTEEQAAREDEVPCVPSPPPYFARDKEQGRSHTRNDQAADISAISKASEATGLFSRNHELPLDDYHQTRATGSYHRCAEEVRDASTSANLASGSTHGIEFAGKNAFTERYSAAGDKGSSLATETPSIKEPWKGRSLEGSAVKEPDPLDMSEEAKTERWFKRVAQIKDISELSQIPDEDFPSIMPIRKGVNRFVVSKRKTPAERRLTSSQHRRNLPVVDSGPSKREGETG
ncbi:Zinc finger protein VAR3, chloroplastic-like protein [Drosera capensis]